VPQQERTIQFEAKQASASVQLSCLIRQMRDSDSPWHPVDSITAATCYNHQHPTPLYATSHTRLQDYTACSSHCHNLSSNVTHSLTATISVSAPAAGERRHLQDSFHSISPKLLYQQESLSSVSASVCCAAPHPREPDLLHS
jgi:hypothetical protein